MPAIALHMGINTGEALVGATKLGGAGAQRWTFTATGPVSNQVARFAGFAQGDEVIVGPLTAERIRLAVVLGRWDPRASRTCPSRFRSSASSPPGVYEKIVERGLERRGAAVRVGCWV